MCVYVCVCVCVCVRACVCVCAQVDQARLLDMLGRVRIGLPNKSDYAIVMVEQSDTNPTNTLRAQLTALGAMQLDPNTTGTGRPIHHEGVQVCINGWDSTPDTIHALRLLPEWQAGLKLWLGDMSLVPAECAKLGEAMSTSYCEWVMDAVTAEQLEAICGGIEERRKGLGLERLYLWIDELDEEREGPVGECVYVRRYPY